MPKFSDMTDGKYVSKSDCTPAILVTIARFAQEMVKSDDGEEQHWVVYFQEIDKGLILKPTNRQLLQIATGCDSTEAAVGKKIVIFVDPTVSMGGKLVGGVRVRAPKGKAAPAPAPAPVQTAPPEAESDDVPF